MGVVDELFENNRVWADKEKAEDPEFFERLARGRRPRFLWIGCADGRVCETKLLGLDVGEVFVHRNIANRFSESDAAAAAVLQYGVERLRIDHVIVCGHYGCGGIAAAMEKRGRSEERSLTPLDEWLFPLTALYAEYEEKSERDTSPEERADRFTEYNVLSQVEVLSRTSVVRNAHTSGRNVILHGWVYDIRTGLLKNLTG
ncbi:MAG: carbonic anhydrase [Simkaniaceae bacterium]|nr:carbonic anhydrase [Simkaniaceae bacterium]